jgi:hypothetical protein
LVVGFEVAADAGFIANAFIPFEVVLPIAFALTGVFVFLGTTCSALGALAAAMDEAVNFPAGLGEAAFARCGSLDFAVFRSSLPLDFAEILVMCGSLA